MLKITVPLKPLMAVTVTVEIVDWPRRRRDDRKVLDPEDCGGRVCERTVGACQCEIVVACDCSVARYCSSSRPSIDIGGADGSTSETAWNNISKSNSPCETIERS